MPANKRVLMTYPQAVGEKASYVVDNGLGGIMVWELSQDHPAFTLTLTLCTKLGLNAAGHTCE